ncbi:hypothetical protein D3C71_1955990 [compost metagenome]
MAFGGGVGSIKEGQEVAVTEFKEQVHVAQLRAGIRDFVELQSGRQRQTEHVFVETTGFLGIPAAEGHVVEMLECGQWTMIGHGGLL